MDHDSFRRSAAHRRAAGFGLVETMVALVIGLLATFIIMQVFATSEGMKRTTTSGADAQSDAAIVLYLIERDIRQAGFGLAPNLEDFVPAYTAPPTGVLTNGILGQCATVHAYKSNRATTVDFTYASSTFAPVVINPPGYPAADAGTDIVLVNYGGSGGMVGKGVLLLDQAGGTTQTGGTINDYRVDTDLSSRSGLQQGDMILAVPPAGSGLDCTIGEVTGLPGAIGCTVPESTNLRRVNHNAAIAYPSAYTSPPCDVVAAPATSVWNDPAAPIAYDAGSKLYNLGPVGAFVSRVYAVRKGNLTMCDLTLNDCTAAVADPPNPAVWAPIAPGVVGLRAQYGKDTDGDHDIDNWEATPQPTGTLRAQVVAVRLAVVAKSKQYEKTAVTTAAPVWSKDAGYPTDISVNTASWPSDWQQYRYRTAQSIVPLRNMIWGQQNLNRPRISSFPRRAHQRGIVLIVALLVMVATILAAIALVSSVDVATLISGNLAFRQGAVHASDHGVEVARRWLMTQPNAVLGVRTPGTYPFYWPTLNGGAPPNKAFDPTSSVFWADSNLNVTYAQLPADAAGNTLSYVVHRMCEDTDASGDPRCFTALTTAAGGDSNRIKEPQDFPCFVNGENLCASSGSPYYRITVRVQGPRSTLTYVQAVIY